MADVTICHSLHMGINLNDYKENQKAFYMPLEARANTVVEVKRRSTEMNWQFDIFSTPAKNQ